MHASTQTLQCRSRPFLRQLTCRRVLVSPVRSQSGSDPQPSKQQKVPGAFNRFFKDLDKAIPQVEDRSSQAQQSRGSRSPQISRSSPRDVRRDNIKKTENSILDLWSNSKTFAVFGALTVVLLLIYAVSY